MLHRPDDILKLLPLLDSQIADELESESLDFKECADEAMLREQARDMAVCLVNNGFGGTVVFGVKDKVKGRARAVVGIDFAPDLDRLKKHLYDSIDPKLLVQFEWLPVDSVRLLLMQAEPTLPSIYTTSSGSARIRVGKDCVPLTGSVRQQALEKLGGADPTAQLIDVGDPMSALSPGALEILRREMRNLDAPRDLLAYPDAQLCEKLGILREGQLPLAGLLLVGKPEVIAKHAPNHEWQYTRMRSDREVLKRRVLLLLKETHIRNQDIRALTGLDRQQALLLMKELEAEELVYSQGRGSAAYWYLGKNQVA